ncbi:amidohydrolase/deacetylase family metallohydrolase [Enterococcus hulanensis]|uniref:Amidohydrolase/deacetylase family metallohydrolase n=1 Tax=Enterococcus hulanensis TaxID=2559929 RepID=A0ABU3F6N9_9ENTE|nr:amidohydrolase/deacetylase family metallohydrolase [Enterococcus hulanensis]MDT2601831.1 amidohydrolase/deacetylase family metallohydrolase [Enterococcus hulanensis]MDT2611216.1 amidohydrolase/deacetylase family metallohydrolase [Enterococcus hulanensis]MDT2618498.1 amidohydrolase/deacetylase family metallohydrolase [Enterococcus hulanensis]MDT2629643.1 amidohydrolase/deacetylase family metallohydrolase [Enterococcus hulanensis]MDT2657375.1 amidohydrolase/deacetylase family metallohydrolase
MLDLVVRNAKTIDGQKFALGISDGKIVEVADEIIGEGHRELVLDEEHYLSPGWIDDHVHCYEKMTLYYDYPDEVGVKRGVTTVIDAGTTGAENIGDFCELAGKSKTNVYALLNISKWGIVEQDELADLTKVQQDAVRTAIEEYPDFIVGLKARMSKTVIGSSGIEPLKLAKKFQSEYGELPLMVHVGSAPPELSDIMALMDKGDVLTHCFNGKENGILDRERHQIKAFAWEAYKKGIIFDIGHGTDSFNFDVAKQALSEGMKSSSISSDIYVRNRKNGPVYDLATTMEKLFVVGYSWEEIIKQVTESPAKNFYLKNKGKLAAGYDADITIFTIKKSDKVLTDSNGHTRTAEEEIVPVKTIIGGQIYDN